jgi:hypothetical protein
MQAFFTLLTALAVGLIARRRDSSFWMWMLLSAVIFLIIDTVVALAILALARDAIHSDAAAILTSGVIHLMMSAAFVVGFFFMMKHVTRVRAVEESAVPQVVGQSCGVCGKVINVAMDALYCAACSTAFRKYHDSGIACPKCGATCRP